jgi:hypothetical protein
VAELRREPEERAVEVIILEPRLEPAGPVHDLLADLHVLARDRDHVDVLRLHAGERQDLLDRGPREAARELHARDPLFVDRRQDAAVLHDGGPAGLAVRYSKNPHGSSQGHEGMESARTRPEAPPTRWVKRRIIEKTSAIQDPGFISAAGRSIGPEGLVQAGAAGASRWMPDRALD